MDDLRDPAYAEALEYAAPESYLRRREFLQRAALGAGLAAGLGTVLHPDVLLAEAARRRAVPLPSPRNVPIDTFVVLMMENRCCPEGGATISSSVAPARIGSGAVRATIACSETAAPTSSRGRPAATACRGARGTTASTAAPTPTASRAATATTGCAAVTATTSSPATTGTTRWAEMPGTTRCQAARATTGSRAAWATI
jgi:hypothetical protein